MAVKDILHVYNNLYVFFFCLFFSFKLEPHCLFTIQNQGCVAYTQVLSLSLKCIMGQRKKKRKEFLGMYLKNLSVFLSHNVNCPYMTFCAIKRNI